MIGRPLWIDRRRHEPKLTLSSIKLIYARDLRFGCRVGHGADALGQVVPTPHAKRSVLPNQGMSRRQRLDAAPERAIRVIAYSVRQVSCPCHRIGFTRNSSGM